MSEKWVIWEGGADCPLPKGTRIDARDKDGTVWEDQIVGESEDIDDWFWTWEGKEYNHIEAYRIK